MMFLTSLMSFLGMTIIQQETNIIGETDNTETGESQSLADDMVHLGMWRKISRD
jgi:hypothetical protein